MTEQQLLQAIINLICEHAEQDTEALSKIFEIAVIRRNHIEAISLAKKLVCASEIG